MDSYDKNTTIEKLLDTAQTIAVVGFSSKTEKAGHYVAAYLQEQGYRIIPVNPTLSVGLGETAYPDLASIPEPVDLVLIFRRPEAVPPFVEDAIAIGAPAVWMQLGIANEAAAARGRDAGLDVVEDACMLREHKARRAAGA